MGNRILYLDGIRAFAVIFVVMQHYGLKPEVLKDQNFGLFGVHLFFALSGYLITGLLITRYDPNEQGWRKALGRFWVSRAFRIVPLVYLALLFLAFVPFEGKDIDLFIWNGLFLTNVNRAITGTDLPFTGHFWSVALEMQFYLFFPIFFWLVPARARTVALIALLVTNYKFAPLFAKEIALPGSGFLLPARLDAFLYGAIFATIPVKWRSTAASLGLLIAVCGMIALQHGYRVIWWTNWFNLLAASIVAGAAFLAPLKSALSIFPFVWIGQISYGIYVWHLTALVIYRPTISLMVKMGVPAQSIIPFTVWIGITACFTIVSWFAVEKPMMAIGRRISAKMSSEREQRGALERTPRAASV